MNALQTINAGHATPEVALELFDSLEPVDIDFMLGSWQGGGFHTGHPLDGLLEAYRWHGKRFDSAEQVHPLVFRSVSGKLVCVNPALVAPGLALADRLPVPRSVALGRVFQFALPLVRTAKARARLRMTTFRGKTSATMIYDQLPINDVFRKVDDNTVLGLMDFKGMKQPFFFVLRREQAGH